LISNAEKTIVFYFSTDAKTVYNSFFIELLENCVTAYVWQWFLACCDAKHKKQISDLLFFNGFL